MNRQKTNEDPSNRKVGTISVMEIIYKLFTPRMVTFLAKYTNQKVKCTKIYEIAIEITAPWVYSNTFW